MKRWALARKLRSLSRDWSPFPVTSSTNSGLVSNYLGEDRVPDEEVAVGGGGEGEGGSIMRWSMRRTEVRFPFLSSFVFFDADVMCRERIGALIGL